LNIEVCLHTESSLCLPRTGGSKIFTSVNVPDDAQVLKRVAEVDLVRVSAGRRLELIGPSERPLKILSTAKWLGLTTDELNSRLAACRKGFLETLQ